MAQLDTARYGIPDPFPFQEARTLFKGVLPSMLVVSDLLTCPRGWFCSIAVVAKSSYCIRVVVWNV